MHEQPTGYGGPRYAGVVPHVLAGTLRFRRAKLVQMLPPPLGDRVDATYHAERPLVDLVRLLESQELPFLP